MHLRLILAAALLSACQLALPGQGPDAPTQAQSVNPITTGEISVTALDAPTPTQTPAAKPEPEPSVAPQASEPAQTVAPTPPAPPPASPPAPERPKSASQIACEKGKGNWVAAGTTGTMICQTPLRDGGKQCTRESDCEGECLARSRSCAPFAPLFGCNEVLQNNGQRVTLCIE